VLERIVVFSRSQVEELARKSVVEQEEIRAITGPYAIISIVGTEDEPAVLPLSADFALRLVFDDILENMDGQEIPIIGGTPQKLKFITEEDAFNIVHFMAETSNQICLLIVHCEGGISRSAGVAVAIAEQFSLAMMGSLMSKHEYFNRDVYRRVKQAYLSVH